MSLESNVIDLAVSVGTELKETRTLVNGNAVDLSALTTTPKTTLVAALNWLHAELQSVAGGSAGINDSAMSTNTTWSSTKTNTEIQAAIDALVDGAPGALDTIKELADALGGQSGTITAIETALANRVRYDAAQTLTGPEQVQARSNIGAGTSNLALGTTGSTAKAGDYQPTVAQISNASTLGRTLMQAADAAAARTAIGAGTGNSNLVIGTTSTTAKAGDYTPPTASTTVQGVVELATTAETQTGADTARAVTPAGLKAVADTKAATTHTHTLAQISDASPQGRSLMSASDGATARGLIGAGTSNLAIGTTGSTAKAGNYAPASADISDATTVGRAVLTAATAGAALTALGAVSAAAVGNTERNFVADFQAALV